MSCFKGRSNTDDKKASQTNSTIEKQMKVDHKSRPQKLLLLGTGDAGKSTFCKQMVVIHSGGFKKEEVIQFSEILRDNCLLSMQNLILAANEWDIKFDRDLDGVVDSIVKAQTELTPEMAKSITVLAESNAIKEVLKRANELQIPGGGCGAQYFFDNCARFAEADYQPTTDDIIRAKMRTTGISEVQFRVQGTDFTLVDVGGQRSERRKWLHCFGDVTAVIFLVAMNEYDMVLEEDNKTNRMEESLKLFQKLTGSQWFDHVPFILFLNKSDLFAERIKSSPLKDTFIDYEEFVSGAALKSANDEDRGYEYIKTQYANNFAGAKLYPFRTCAIDKDNCQKVFAAVKDAILSTAVGMAGI